MQAFARSPQPRPEWPDAPHMIDPDLMHPRAVEMAQAMREGATRYDDIAGAGFSPQEIKRFGADARTLARTLATRQISPGGDRLSEMADKALAAIEGQWPVWKGTGETQALVVSWGAYCRARNAFVLDPSDAQRLRCIEKLTAFFAATPAGAAATRHVVEAVDRALRRELGR